MTTMSRWTASRLQEEQHQNTGRGGAGWRRGAWITLRHPALHRRRDRSDLPQVVLLDLKLPRLEALEVLRRIRAEGSDQDIADRGR